MTKITLTLTTLALFAVASASDTSTCAAEFEQCHGHGIDKCCTTGTKCYNQHDSHGLCLKACPEGWACHDTSDEAAPLAAGQRFIVTYDIDDRCENYNLAGCVNSASGDTTDESAVSPYHGTHSQDGEWYFQDTVTFEKDAATLKFTITYGHDRLNALRKRVVLMRQDGDEYLQYDEVTVADADGISTVHMTGCQTTRPAQPLHHVKPFLKNPDNLDFEPEVTAEGIHGHAYFAPQDMPHEIESDVTGLFSGGVYVSADVTNDGFEATQLVRDVDMVIAQGEIAWPSADLCEAEVVGFEDGIPLRADLDAVATGGGRRLKASSSRKLRGTRKLFNLLRPSTCPKTYCSAYYRYVCGSRTCSYSRWGMTIWYTCGDRYCSIRDCTTLHFPCYK